MAQHPSFLSPVPAFRSGRVWQIVEKFKVSIFYTAPAAIRALMKRRRKMASGQRPLFIETSRFRWRAHQSGSAGCLVSQIYRRRKVSYRRYVVADRNRRNPYYPASRRMADNSRGYATLPFFGVDARALQPRSSGKSRQSTHRSSEQGELCIADSWRI